MVYGLQSFSLLGRVVSLQILIKMYNKIVGYAQRRHMQNRIEYSSSNSEAGPKNNLQKLISLVTINLQNKLKTNLRA